MTHGMTKRTLLHQALPSLSVTEWALNSGYDGVVIDLQHGEVGLEQACTMLRAAPRSCTDLMVRIGSLETGPITRLLDSGAKGIIAPTVETAEQSRSVVNATKYPPLGLRSLGPSRPALYQGDSYTEAGNQTVRVVVQIETAKGVEAAESILDVPGIDAVYIGPADLAVTYGLPGRADWDEGPVWNATVKLSALCKERGIELGTYCSSPVYARRLILEDFVDFVGLGIDLLFVARTAENTIEKFRGSE